MEFSPQNQHVAALIGIRDGANGIADTLAIMRAVVREYKKDPSLRALALQIIGPVAERDYVGQVIALHAFVRDSIKYVDDIDQVETVQTPDVTLQVSAGDCDDKSVLLATLLCSIGHPCRFVAIGQQWGVYEHVYIETKIGTRWIAAETTEAVNLGWEPPRHMVKVRMIRDC